MSFTVTEALALNVLLDHLTLELRNGREVTTAEAQEAAEILAASAYKRLGAGVTPETVKDRWHRVGAEFR